MPSTGKSESKNERERKKKRTVRTRLPAARRRACGAFAIETRRAFLSLTISAHCRNMSYARTHARVHDRTSRLRACTIRKGGRIKSLAAEFCKFK